MSDGTSNTEVIAWDAPAGAVESKLNAILGASTVDAEKLADGVYRVHWQAYGAVSALTADASPLVALQGVSGTLDLTTAAAKSIGGPGGVKMIAELTVGSTTEETLFSEPVTFAPWR